MNAEVEAEVIAIDGPSASGKSTIARRVAESLGRLYVDSGALYRVVTWRILEQGVAVDDLEAVTRVVDSMAPVFFVEEGAVRFSIDGLRPDTALREERINANVSRVAAYPAVRRRVVAWLRGMARFGALVMEGRDIGTAVFPGAGLKFYLDASPEERARRRHRDREAAGVSREDVYDSIERRDRIDSTREMDPLKVAEGAVRIDSTGLEIEQTVAAVLSRIAEGS